jgi:RND family efflux transporter MFP subunit
MIRGTRKSEPPAVGAIVLAVLLTTGVVGCGPAEVAEGPPPVRPIKMVEIGDALSTVNRQYPGRIAPALEAQLGFEVAGRIISFPVDEGQNVRQGQVLARLDPSDYEAQLDAAQADVKAAEADFERFRALLDKNAVSERDFQMRERNFEVAQSRLRIAEKKVADTQLTAPFSGRVARKLMDDYQNVQAKQPVVLLQDESRLQIKVDVPEADVTLAGPGRREELEAWVTVIAYPERAFEAEVAELSTAADPVTRTFEATLSFTPDDDVNVMPGMTARVSVAARSAESVSAGFAVPAVCVATADDGAAYVWKVDPETLEVSRANVEVGELTGANIVVRSGLSSGDLIAVSGVHHLRQGMKVRRLK